MSSVDKLWNAIQNLLNTGKSPGMTPAAQRLEKLTKEMEGKCVEIGFNEQSGSYEDGTTMAQVAAWNEFGTERSPSRPFMRQTIKDYQGAITKYTAKSLRSAVKSHGTVSIVLNRVGAYTKGKMQREIRDGEWTPNAPSTIARKGSDKPLIDTGQMRQRIVYVVKDKES